MRAIALLPLAVCFLLTGCSNGRGEGVTSAVRRPTIYDPPSGESCLRYWNATSNKANRGLVRRSGYRSAELTLWYMSHAAPGRSRGCSFLLHNGNSYLSIGGAWDGIELVWGFPPTTTGYRQEGLRDDAAVRADGRLRER